MEERNKWFEEGIPLSEMGSRWDSMELKKGSVPVPVTDMMDSEVSRKWMEFERMSFRDMSAQSLIGAQTYQSSTEETLQSFTGPQTCQSSCEDARQSLIGSQMNQSYTKEAFQSLIGSQTNQSTSEVEPQSLNGAQIIQSSTPEALQREVRS